MTAFHALVVTNSVPLEAIATMGSSGFCCCSWQLMSPISSSLDETSDRAWLFGLAALSTGFALVEFVLEAGE